jgi:crotonobetaine/carnitine-CoA ligase
MYSAVRPSLVGCRDARAVVVPVNIAYRGDLLRTLLEMKSPTMLIAGEPFATGRAGLDSATPARVVRPGDLRERWPNAQPDHHSVQVWDTHALMLTSGTTGPSKLVKLTHQNTHFGGSAFFETRQRMADDIFQVDVPLYDSGHPKTTNRAKVATERNPKWKQG